MFQKLKLLRQVAQNMGWRYFSYRIGFEIKRRTGWLKKDFPTSVPLKTWISLEEWKISKPHFFFESKETIRINKDKNLKLKQKFENNKNGIFSFFSAIDYNLGKSYDWITNPDNGYQYDLKHWTDIPDYSAITGDIKYVWEKSRFTYLYNAIRYDYHFGEEQSVFTFKEILSWIDANPVNQGPNWRCSQEISLRVLNWIFAIYYYKNSTSLTDESFKIIMNSIYWQMKHVRANINFSRIAVRNNHAITETLALYLVGLLMPHFEEASEWKIQGKKWFEEEIAYQVYEDGTFLQFSMNYHRVVVQLLTWAIVLSEKNSEKFNNYVYERAAKSLEFLQVCQDETSGHLPNYGANDGALFFPLSEADYRDFSPQLNALNYCLKAFNYIDKTNCQEDIAWFLGETKNEVQPIKYRGVFTFKDGGYYIIKEENVLTFVRCGKYKDRPSHADNLHLDIWVKGENILRDAGSYKYNTTSEFIGFFTGTQSHNTVMLGSNNQMLKGPRFIWFNWTQALSAIINDEEDAYIFKGKVQAFGQLGNDIWHERTIKKTKNKLNWEVIDKVHHKTNLPIIQIWNPLSLENVNMDSVDENNSEIKYELIKGWYSGYYGIKTEAQQLIFANTGKIIITKIKAI